MSEDKFAVTSRYYGVARAKRLNNEGREIAYLKRRFVPRPGGVLYGRHRLEQGDRLDLLAAKYLGDPEQYWRLCDVNGALHPQELMADVGEWVDIAVQDNGGSTP